MPRDEAGRRGLLHDDIYDVLAVQVARPPQERLFAVVVVFLDELERRRVVSVRIKRNRLLESPARERSRGVLYVLLRVIAHTHREQLQQLAAPVLVRLTVVVLVVIQPEDHRRVLGKLQQDRPHVGHAHIAEHLYLVHRRHHMLVLRDAGGENMVPEQRHLLLQRPLRIQHSVQPDAGENGIALAAEVSLEDVLVDFRQALRIHKVLHHGLISLRH